MPDTRKDLINRSISVYNLITKDKNTVYYGSKALKTEEDIIELFKTLEFTKEEIEGIRKGVNIYV